MTAHTIKLPSNLEAELESLVDGTGLPKSYFLIEAFRAYVHERKRHIRTAAIMEKVAAGEMRVKSLNNITAKQDLAG